MLFLLLLGKYTYRLYSWIGLQKHSRIPIRQSATIETSRPIISSADDVDKLNGSVALGPQMG